MNKLCDQFELRRIERTSPDHMAALHLAVRDDLAGTGHSSQTVSSLLAAAGRGSCSLDLAFGAYEGDRLANAAMAMVFPGSAALVLFPCLSSDTWCSRTNVVLLQAVVEAARGRSVALLQALIPPVARHAARDLRRAGFRYLTNLVYLVGRSVAPRPAPQTPEGLSWVSYELHNEDLFCRALELSYAHSLDCPELSGLRCPADILAGHRATGIFDASLWWVAMRSGAPVGIALLNRVPGLPTMEIVYIGVTERARGKGVADALMERMVVAARGRGALQLTLAVDCRNTPARRMYQRWGFTPLTEMDAWIANAAIA